MHPALRKGPLFYKIHPPFSTFLPKHIPILFSAYGPGLPVCLVVPSIDSSCNVQLVCCIPGRAAEKYLSIAAGDDRAAGSVMLRAEVRGSTQTCLARFLSDHIIFQTA